MAARLNLLASPTRAACAALALFAADDRARAGPPARPDTFVARVEALASMETLNAEILGSSSATRTLEAWCATHAMAQRPVLKAVHLRDDKPADASVRQLLGVGAGDPVRYRHVQLTCGDHVLSDADNWYVPSRLTAEMNQVLDTTETPFGKVVAPLGPTRQTIAADVLWKVLPPGWELRPPPPDHPQQELAIPPVLFAHKAVLYDGARRAISLVDEHYTREVLAYGDKPDAAPSRPR